LLKQRRRSHEILRNARTLFVEHAEARATVHRILFTSALKQLERASRVATNASSGLEHGTEAGAPFPNAAGTRAIEECCGARLVAEDVLSFSQLHGELGARGGVSRLARAAQLLGFPISGTACRK
jgi:hypothetical protein